MSEADRIAYIAFDLMFGVVSLVGGCWIILTMCRRYRGEDSGLDRFLLGEPKRHS